MKKINGFFAMCMVGVFAFAGCASVPKTKDISGPTEIIEHKGTAFGVAQPDWVQAVLVTSNQKRLCKARKSIFEKQGCLKSKIYANIKTWVGKNY